MLVVRCAACCFLIVAAGASCASPSKVRPLTGVYYFPGWYRSAPGEDASEPGEWRGCIIKGATPRPAARFYNDADPRLWDYYLRWMSTRGIDFIAFDWYYNAGQQYLERSLEGGYLGSPSSGKVKFAVHWCNHGGGWWNKPLDQGQDANLQMMDLLCERYFSRENYLKIDGRPVFMIYDINQLMSFGGQQATRKTLAAIRARAVEKGFDGLYLVAVYSGSSPDTIAMLNRLGFDAFCAYTYSYMRPPEVAWNTNTVPYPALADLVSRYLYPHLARMGRAHDIPYWPTTFSGWDDRPRAGLENGWVLSGNRPEDFGKMFRTALDHVNPESPVVMVEAWNEWGEGACIEPSREHGFGYLDEIARALGKRGGDRSLPSDDEISSWSALNAAELGEAKESESKPWPIKPVKRYPLKESRFAPRAAMPVVFDLTASGIPADALRLEGVEIAERGPDGTVFQVTGADPQIILPAVEVPKEQIRRIVLDGRILDSGASGAGPANAEIYWTTALMPDFAWCASAAFPWFPGRGASIVTRDIAFWEATGTPVLRLRIDPPNGAGVKLRLRQVTLEER